jgi:hypothetical protein
MRPFVRARLFRLKRAWCNRVPTPSLHAMRPLLVALLFLVPSVASAAFRCVDSKGSTHFEETPPAACGNAPIYEVSRSGMVIRTLAPASSDSRIAKPDEGKGGAQADRSAVDQKRRDRALVESYASEKEIDAARDRNLELIAGRLSGATQHLKQVTAREAALDRSVQSAKAPSPKLVSDLQAARDEKRSLETSVQRLEKEMDRTRSQFDADKRRWAELRDKR